MSTYYNASGEVREIDDALFAQWVAAGNPKAQGWTLRPDAPAYDAKTQQCAWVDGAWVVTELPPPPRHITVLAFRNRFTQSEKIAIEIAALDNPAAAMPQRAQSAALRANQLDVQAANYIDLDRTDTRAGVQALEAATILAAGRALEILDAPIAAHEEFHP